MLFNFKKSLSILLFILLISMTACSQQVAPSPEAPTKPAPTAAPTKTESSLAPGFIQAEGNILINSNNKTPFRLRAVKFTHEPVLADYADAAKLGFNSVRLTLNLDQFSQAKGFPWLDQQIAWTRASNLYLIINLSVAKPFDPGQPEKIVAFWQELAKHYPDENAIAAFDLLQEPQPPHLDDWQILAEKVSAAIRASDNNHLLIVQATRSPERSFIYLNDNNMMLGLLYFKPFPFTSMGQGKYPDTTPYYPDYNLLSLTESSENIKVPPGTSLWTEMNSSMLQVNNRETAIGWPGVTCSLESGDVYFSNFEVNEYDESQNFVRQVMAIDLQKDKFWGPWTRNSGVSLNLVDGSPWGADQSKSIKFKIEGENNSNGGTVTDQAFTFEPVVGYNYTIHGWARGVNVNPGARCQFNIEFYTYKGYDEARNWTPAALKADFASLAKYGTVHNLPMMLLEYGTTRDSFEKGGGAWVTDMLENLDKLGWSYGYRAYRDKKWGIYTQENVSDPNAELVKILQRPEITLARSTATVVPSENSVLPIGFVKANGRDLKVGDQIIHLRGTNFANQNYFGVYQSVEHSKRDFMEVKNLGMNLIRFDLHYRFFEKDDAPGQYDPQALAWLDKQISWAKEAGVYIILNMHYVPGQFETGLLLSGPEEQQRAADLWRNLAQRYKDETIIAGYDLINEPAGIEAEPYRVFAQKLVDSIREVDPNHMIVVEAINQVPAKFVKIVDQNVMYDFHFYYPLDLTHENNGNPQTGPYPDPTFLELRWDTGLQFIGKTSTPNLPADTSNWSLQKSPVQSAGGNGKGVIWGYPKFTCGRGTGLGTAYLGDFQVLTFDAVGNALPPVVDLKITKDTWRSIGSNNNRAQFGLYPENGINTPEGRSLVISNADEISWIEFTRYAFEAVPGQKYQIIGWMRGENLPKNSSCSYLIEWFQYPPGQILYRHDRAYLEERLQVGLKFSQENNVPLNIGEFGVASTSFLDKRGGLRWMSDVIDLLLENNINFAHWSYTGFWGLYADDWHYPDTADIRNNLADVFRNKLKATGVTK